jgi:outer membrane protein assembly factor BamE (lipoprotein component of BamABCDE complex)
MKSMEKTSSLLVSAAVSLLLAGCAGTDFKRPDASVLKVGKSTTDDVIRVMGPARATGEVLKNSCRVRQSTYVYATAVGASLYGGVTPSRAMTFSTYNDLLVGEQFISSFKEDGTDFDDSNVAAIVKGKTTKSEVIAALGNPSGEAIYPLVKNQGDTAIVYAYVQVKTSPFKMKAYQKSLTVSIGANDLVTDVEFVEAGDK